MGNLSLGSLRKSLPTFAYLRYVVDVQNKIKQNNFQHDIILNKSRTQSTRIAGFHTIGFIGMSLFTRPPQVVQ